MQQLASRGPAAAPICDAGNGFGLAADQVDAIGAALRRAQWRGLEQGRLQFAHLAGGEQLAQLRVIAFA